MGVYRELVGVEENHRFEEDAVIGLDIRFGEEFEFLPYELNTLAVGTIHEHYVRFDFLFIVLVYPTYEIV